MKKDYVFYPSHKNFIECTYYVSKKVFKVEVASGLIIEVKDIEEGVINSFKFEDFKIKGSMTKFFKKEILEKYEHEMIEEGAHIRRRSY